MHPKKGKILPVCVQNSLSARNFVGFNAKDYTCYLENPATKNDSEKEFYKLRDIIFEALSEKSNKIFPGKC